MSECATINCDTTQDESCAVEQSLSQGCCPVEKAVGMWTGSFFQAMKGAQVDILKEKIRNTWGPVMEKEADAVIEAMGVHWKSVMAQAKAQVDLRENIKSLQHNLA